MHHSPLLRPVAAPTVSSRVLTGELPCANAAVPSVCSRGLQLHWRKAHQEVLIVCVAVLISLAIVIARLLALCRLRRLAACLAALALVPT